MFKVSGFGLNKYGVPHNDLSGCVPDNQHAQKLCQHRGIPDKNMQFIFDADATYKNSVELLEWTGADLTEDDWSVVFWSSHGTQVVDLDGDETDGFDEALCCYDIDWDSKGRVRNVITDDKFSQIIEKSRSKWAIFIDACHSELYDRTFKKWIPKTITPPLEAKLLLQKIAERGLKKREVFSGINRVQVISACRAGQTSADTFLGGEPRGAGSFYFEQIQYKTPAMPCTDISVDLCIQMERNGYTQRPASQGGLIHLPFAGGLK